jgi:phage terminase small subunit
MALTPKQERFIAEYLIDLNATQAAIRAGYSPKTAGQQGDRLLKNVQIASAITKGKSAQVERAELSAAMVLEELRRLATVDIRSYYDALGNLKPMSELTPEQGAALAGVETLKRNVTAGDGVMDTVYKIKLWDKTRALEMLAKHFALLTEVIKVEDEAGQIAKLLAGRKRAAEARKKGDK